MELVQLPQKTVACEHWINGAFTHTGQAAHTVTSPYTGQVIGEVWEATAAEVDAAVTGAVTAQKKWAATPLKERTQVMFRLRELLLQNAEKLSHTISAESGKLLSEANAGLMKGIEVLEFAISLQNLDRGGRMEVSRGVFCENRREALGVVAGITPFNFPAMVPMWMLPIALTVGNAFIWKPSDKTPLTSLLLAKLFQEAGLPAGVLQVIQGGKGAVEHLCDAKEVRAIGFVGSTPVAQAVYKRATANFKRALTLGGAKNHVILMPDADINIAAPGIVASFTGCAGQRCMAASALVAVGDVSAIIDKVVQEAKTLSLGKNLGAIITKESLTRLHGAIAAAEKDGATILLDGREVKAPSGYESGNWLGPTILDNVKPGSTAACEELFGPVLSIIRADSLSQALEIENASDYGNACSVFTTSGAVAEAVAQKARAGMIGVNIGVPVPREPFSFGGHYESKFGSGDITGEPSLNFWSELKKVTMKWDLQKDQNWMS